MSLHASLFSSNVAWPVSLFDLQALQLQLLFVCSLLVVVVVVGLWSVTARPKPKTGRYVQSIKVSQTGSLAWAVRQTSRILLASLVASCSLFGCMSMSVTHTHKYTGRGYSKTLGVNVLQCCVIYMNLLHHEKVCYNKQEGKIKLRVSCCCYNTIAIETW